ncbi:CBS domain-containing protein [Mangrovihabitans endophyticus]|uniref:CBS domain-containing protein n=1 Tax=Mangrovihabitans endophyticus TaxID=1751298 RepID=A0A8J3C586_9ACTN|nr:CBS domain-containing protein [Mangrovihabitans endophyticus]GGL19694.1 CBS domain-containing protein [Mangrovihabitans endophyticus]
MRAKDIMTSPVHTVRRGEPVEVAARLMAEHGVTALPVLDEAGALVGMVSEGDLLFHRVPADPTAHLVRQPYATAPRRPGIVAEVMAGEPYTTRPGADVADVAERMLRHDVRSMPVVEDGVVVGIVSRRDILRVMVRTDEVLAGEVQHRLDEYADGRRRWTVVVSDGVVRIDGDYTDDTERTVVAVLARTVPGVAAVTEE